jgi:hypothetical protein
MHCKYDDRNGVRSQVVFSSVLKLRECKLISSINNKRSNIIQSFEENRYNLMNDIERQIRYMKFNY